jgi:type IV pilus assembly protein PilA
MQNPPAYPNQAPYQPGPPMQQPQKKSGFPVWAIVLIVVFGLILVFVLVLVTLGIYGTRKYLAAAKTAEAKNSIGAISRAAVAAYESEQLVGDKVVTNRLCQSASAVPASMSSVSAKKYMPSSAPGADFNAGDAQTGWPCLKFSMMSPMYYRYQYRKGSGYVSPLTTPGANGFEASAQGDLDGNGVASTFSRGGVVGPSGALVLAPTMAIDKEFE